ncbi:MAG: hypothetical protein GY856_28050 [bacterium]|nr:hypothetical protein [bacterium]
MAGCYQMRRLRVAGWTPCGHGLGRYPEAEPLLLNAYPMLKEKRGERVPCARDALRRIVTLL